MTLDNIKKLKVHKVITCSLDSSVSEISEIMRSSNERRIFVIDANSKLLGIITSTDLVYKALIDCKKAEKMSAKDVMISGVKSVDVTQDLEKALQIMNELKTFTCPVVDNGKILGVISYHELTNYIFDNLQKIKPSK